MARGLSALQQSILDELMRSSWPHSTRSLMRKLGIEGNMLVGARDGRLVFSWDRDVLGRSLRRLELRGLVRRGSYVNGGHEWTAAVTPALPAPNKGVGTRLSDG